MEVFFFLRASIILHILKYQLNPYKVSQYVKLLKYTQIATFGGKMDTVAYTKREKTEQIRILRLNIKILKACFWLRFEIC